MTSRQPVAIVGMGVVLPGISTPEALWNVLCGDRHILGEPTIDRMDLTHFWAADPGEPDRSRHRHGGFVDRFTPHPELLKEIRAGAWPATEDPPATWLRHCALQALQDVTVGRDDHLLIEVAVAVDTLQVLETRAVGHSLSRLLSDALEDHDDGRGAAQALRVRRILGRRYGSDVDGHLPDDICRRAFVGVLPPWRELDIVTVTCASGLMAINLAVMRLQAGECDVAVCGAAHELTPRAMVALSNAGVLADIPEIRALDRGAHGTAFGDGAALVTLKTLDRARADADEVLGIITGCGAASDGKGKSLGAPNPRGQRRAITHAWDVAGIGPHDLDVILAHGTGTRAGDPVEVDVLRHLLLAERDTPIPVVSNKSLVGHTGSCAGMVSVLHGILALRHEIIPAQRYFDAADGDLGPMVIPTAPVPWPRRDDRPRVAAVSAFGLGGVNTHVVLSDRPTSRTSGSPAPAQGGVVLTAWSGQFPEYTSREAVEQWLAGAAPPPPASFGDSVATSTVMDLCVPPVTVQHMDRTEIMALHAVGDLSRGLEPAWNRLRAATGVVVAHAGHMRAAILNAQRCYLADCAAAVGTHDDKEVRAAFDAVSRKLHEQVPPTAPDTAVTTVGASLIGGWVTNYFDLHGPHLAVETNDDAGLSALRIAEQYLLHGGMDLMVVVGANANSEPELTASLPAALRARATVAEGCVAVALTRRGTAEELALPILATLSSRPTVTPANPVASGQPDRARGRTYVGADGLLAVVRAVATGESTEIVPSQPDRPSVTVELPSTAVGRRGGELTITRTRLEFNEAAVEGLPPGRQPIPSLNKSTLVITDDRVMADVLRRHESCTTWVVGTPTAEPPTQVEHIRVLCRLNATSSIDPWTPSAISRLRALHDLAFSALKRFAPQLATGATFAVLLMDAVRHQTPHPFVGAFSGLMKTVSVEFPQAHCWCVVTDTPDLGEALEQLGRESRVDHHLGVVLLQGDRRLGYCLTALDPPGDTTPPPAVSAITKESVIVATGGAGGVMGPLLEAFARDYAPTIYILGRTQPPQPGPVGPLPDRAQFIVEQRHLYPHTPLKTLAVRWDTARKQHAISDILTRLTMHSGRDRVHYLVCDITDEAAVRHAIDHVHAAEGGIDLLIHAASAATQGAIPGKDMVNFQQGRDTKLVGYTNLRRAVGDKRPRLWCNFGSVIGFVGWPAEADYASANDFLTTAAMWSSHVENATEFTLNWTAWDGLGITGDPVIQDTMRRQGITQFMSPREACLRFRQALNDPCRPPVIVHLPDCEREVVAAQAPHLRIQPPLTNHPVAARPFISSDDNHMFFDHTYDVQVENHLAAHIIRGRPLMPASVPLEMSLEVALRLVPGMTVTGFRDLELRAPLRAAPNRPKTVRASATIVERQDDHARIRAWITSFIRHPGDGRILTERLHSEVDVILAKNPPPPPRWNRLPAMPSRAVPNPIYLPNDCCHASGPYLTSTGHTIGSTGAHSTLLIHDPSTPPGFATFGRLPTVLFQGILELAFLVHADQHSIPLMLMRRIAAIDLYTQDNDAGVLAAHGRHLEFFADPPGPGSRLLALANGGILLQASGVDAALIGRYDIATRSFHDHAAAEEIRFTTDSQPVPDWHLVAP